MLYVLRLTILLLLSSLPAAASELEKDVQQTLDRAKRTAAEIQLPVTKHQEVGMSAAQESVRVFNSPEFQEKLRCEQQRLKKEVFTEYTKVPSEEEAPASDKLAENEKLYLFFSSSIPEEAIHAYLAAVERLGEPEITVLMRGFVPGERHKYLLRISQKDRNCVDHLQQKQAEICERFEIPIKIHPSLFDKYEITQVPALVYENGDNAWKITGNARLDYLLEQINRATKSRGLGSLIAILQRGRHE